MKSIISNIKIYKINSKFKKKERKKKKKGTIKRQNKTNAWTNHSNGDEN
jgi:hypothetical protein